MGQVKFGVNQLMNAAPSYIGRIKRVLNFMSAGIILYLPLLAKTFHTDIDTLTSIMGLFMLSFNGIALFFGVEITSDTVKAEDVTEVETGKP